MTTRPISRRSSREHEALARRAAVRTGDDSRPFHGVPQSYLDKGDPYCHCAKTRRLIQEALGLPEERVVLAFSRASGGRNGSSPTPTKR